MAEFCSPENFRVILGNSEGETVAYRLKELLPLGFGAGDLGQKLKHADGQAGSERLTGAIRTEKGSIAETGERSETEGAFRTEGCFKI